MRILCCPSCNQERVRQVGQLRYEPGLINLSDPGWLYRCTSCNLYFRRPYLDQEAITKAYSGTANDEWTYPNDRIDHHLAYRSAVKRKNGGSVLDVGCFRGDFLQLFGPSFSRFGIEPSSQAAIVAESLGVRIIGKTIDSICNSGIRFDVITLIDVIEHLPKPFLALKTLKKILNRDGIIVVSTGNTDALPWRVLRLSYWYYFTEHVSFINSRWCRWTANQLGMKIIEVRKFSHSGAPPWLGLYQLSQCVIYRLWQKYNHHPILRNTIFKVFPFNRAATWGRPPVSKAWKDHILVLFSDK